MSINTDSPWVVLKFGGTSVSSTENWKNVAAVLGARLAERLRPVVVHSALVRHHRSTRAIAAEGALGPTWVQLMLEIEERHRSLARDLGIVEVPELEQNFAELRRIASGIQLIGEVSDRLRARVMATGEMMSTHLGAAYLAEQGLESRMAGRTHSVARRGTTQHHRAHGLSVRDVQLRARSRAAEATVARWNGLPDPGIHRERRAGRHCAARAGRIRHFR